jgi:flagellar protein FliJ
MFQFRLKTLLRLKVAERDERRAELAKALRAEELLREQQATVIGEQAEIKQQARRQKSPGAGNVDRLLATNRYELVLAARVTQLQGQLEQVVAESQRRRLALVEADRHVRTLEKLRERQALAYRDAETRHDAKEMDELAILGHVLRQEVQS